MAPDDDSPPPDRAFWLLSDDTRVAILRALWDASGEVSFTDLRERVGSPDSGLFNYHLDALSGQYVARGADGYGLTQAGREVVRAVLAGSLTERPRLDPGPIDGACVECGGPLVAGYDEHGFVECSECGARAMWNEFPPAGLAGRDHGAFARALDRWTHHRFGLAIDGVCPNCACEMSTERPGPDDDGRLATVHRCPNCKYEARVPLLGHVVGHPAVVSFYYERGVDVTDLAFWDLQALADGYAAELLSTDPWRARVTVETAGDALSLTLDEDLAVAAVDVSA